MRDEWRRQGACLSCGAEAAEGRKLCAEHLRYQREHHAELRAERKAAGLCIQCGLPAGAANLCELHLRANRERVSLNKRKAEIILRNRQEYEERKRAEGLCSSWGCEAPGPVCDFHSDPQNAVAARCQYQRDHVARRMAEGRCVRCGWKSDGPKRCLECRQDDVRTAAERRNERRAAGLCLCGRKPKRDRALCASCAKKRRLIERKRSDRKRAAGICLRCSKPAEVGHTLCLGHQQFYSAARSRLKLRRAGHVLKRAA